MSLATSQHPGPAHDCVCGPATAAVSTPPAHASWRQLTGHIWRQLKWRRQRHDLAGLDDRLLADIGVTRAQARHEACKPFWA